MSAWSRSPRDAGHGGPSRKLDLALEDLPGRALRQLVDEPHLARVLVGGDVLLDVRLQLRGRDRRSVLERHGGADLLAELGMGDPDDRALAHRRVLVEHLLELPRVDVVAAANDQLLLAVDDEEVAVLVDAPDVAGPKPAIGGQDLSGGLRSAPVARHHVVAADGDLADLAGGNLPALRG